MAATLTSILPENIFERLQEGCCGSLPFQKLEIKLKYAVPQGINLSGFKLEVTLDVTNPNSQSISTTGFSYKVTKKSDESVVFAEGSMPEGISIPAGETTELVLPIGCTYSGMGLIGKNLLTTGKIDFVMSGETNYKIPMTETEYTLPYKVEGNFSLSAIGKAQTD